MKPGATPIPDEIRALHAEAPAIDLHADTLMWARWLGYDLHARHVPPLPKAAFAGHVDVPRLREGGIGAQWFGLVSLPVSRLGNRAIVDAQIDALDRACSRGNDLVACRTAAEVEAANRRGAVAALLGIEGAHALDGDLDAVDHFARRGVRYLGLLHFSSNEAGFPAAGIGKSDGQGLSKWGRDLVARCESAGVIVDLAHINRRGWMEVCAMAKRPVYCSHTGVTGAHDHWRNIDDEQLRAVAGTGGAVGVIFAGAYLGGDDVQVVARHVLHMLDVGGEDLPAFGSDYDGMVVPVRGLEDASKLPALTAELAYAGVPPRVLRKIMRDNALRVLRAAG